MDYFLFKKLNFEACNKFETLKSLTRLNSITM